MKTTVGLWIDQRKTVIVTVSKAGEETRVIESHVDRQPGRLAGVRSTTPFESQQVPADDSRQMKLTGLLDTYYEEVASSVRDAESILVFGPGEAKGELVKHLKRYKLGQRVVAVESADKMTDRQIAAKVRDFFYT